MTVRDGYIIHSATFTVIAKWFYRRDKNRQPQQHQFLKFNFSTNNKFYDQIF